MSKLTGCKLLAQSHPILTNLFISLVTIAAIILFAEVIFFVLDYIQKRNNNISVTTSAELYQLDERLAAKPKPNIEVSVQKKIGERTIYDVTYTTDEYSRRITPVLNSEDRTKFILFFGGSFTFGDGVDQNETMPFYVSKLSSRYRPYNYGFPGYGPQQMLAKLESDDVTEEIGEADGILIYTFIDHHVNRAVGTMFIYRLAMGGQYPYYSIEDGNQLVRKGNFSSGRPILTLFYRLLGKSQTLQYFNIDLPIIGENHFRTTAKIIEQSRDIYVEKFNNDKFYVLFYPNRESNYSQRIIPYLEDANPSQKSNYSQRIIPYLEDAGIEYLDYSNLINQSEDGLWILGDGHPTAKTHRIVAENLAKDLGIVDTEMK